MSCRIESYHIKSGPRRSDHLTSQPLLPWTMVIIVLGRFTSKARSCHLSRPPFIACISMACHSAYLACHVLPEPSTLFRSVHAGNPSDGSVHAFSCGLGAFLDRERGCEVTFLLKINLRSLEARAFSFSCHFAHGDKRPFVGKAGQSCPQQGIDLLWSGRVP